jgi:outer membrane protein assembly factor BamB
LTGGKLLCHIINMTALDPATGETLWRTAAKVTWGSPAAARVGETDLIVTPNGDILRVSDGKVLAQRVSRVEYCAPLVDGAMVYFVEHGGKAIRLPASADEPFKPESVWTTEPKKERYYATPVLHDGLLYGVTQQGELSVIDAADGKVVYAKKLNLGGTFYPSITLAGAYLMVSSDNGNTQVLRPGREYVEVGRNVFEPFRSTPVYVGGRFYVRTTKGVACIGD